MTDAATLAGLDADRRRVADRFIQNTYQRTDLTRAEKRRVVADYIARLTGHPSDLELRADQARIEYDRAHHLSRYAEAVKRGTAKPPDLPPPPVEAQPRYWMGCARCGGDIWLTSQRVRLPLCERCVR